MLSKQSDMKKSQSLALMAIIFIISLTSCQKEEVLIDCQYFYNMYIKATDDLLDIYTINLTYGIPGIDAKENTLYPKSVYLKNVDKSTGFSIVDCNRESWDFNYLFSGYRLTLDRSKINPKKTYEIGLDIKVEMGMNKKIRSQHIYGIKPKTVTGAELLRMEHPDAADQDVLEPK